ncbi:MAG: TolC family protein [Saprospiraceae bacterium]|nr:TolC family protein [Saprospiraceae bacterium]
MNKWIFSVVICSVGIHLHSQKSIGLKEAIETALSRNHGIQLSKTDLEISSVQNSWSNTGILPEVIFNLAPTLSFNSLDQKLVNNTEIRRDNARSEQMNANLLFNWNFFKGFKMMVAKDRLEEQVRKSKHQLDLDILDLTYQVALAYYDIIRLQNLIKSAEEQVSFSLERVRQEEIKMQKGLSGKTEFLNAQMDYKDFEILLNQQNQQIKIAKINLLQLMQAPLDSDIFLSDTSIQTKLNVNIDSNNDFSGHPQWSFYQSEQRILQYSKKEIEYERWPGLGLFGAYNFNRTENQAGFSLFSQNYGPQIQLQLSVPLYQGGRIKNESRRMDLNLKKNEITADQWVSGVNHQMETAKQNLLFNEKLLIMADEKIKHAEEIFQLEKEKYMRSESTHLEMRQAQTDMIQAQIVRQDAWYQYMVQLLIIKSLQGDLRFLLE